MTGIPDAIEGGVLTIVERLIRRAVRPTLESELAADLGFDSLRVLELVAEIEDHFNIYVPLNELDGITTVGGVLRHVRSLIEQQHIGEARV